LTHVPLLQQPPAPHVPDVQDQVDGFDAAERTQVWLPYGANADGALLDAFLEGIRTGVPPQPDGLVGVRTARIVEAAYASAASGQPVPQ
jgi:1,5-anhydro-D-fructose reductase (1,5-anhydro-D-mannitol-forming)